MSSSPSSTRHVPRGVADLVDARIRQWQLEREREPPKEVELPRPRVVVISRQVGSGGGALARLVASQLKLDIWDRKIVHEIAERSGVRESLLATLDEHGRSLLAQLRDSLSGHDEEHVAYARRLSEVVQTIGHHGDAVIVGRGAQFVLDPKSALAVRVIAPMAERAMRVAEREGLSVEESTKLLKVRQKDRQTFVRQHFGEDVADACHYDIVINTGRMSLKQATMLVVASYEAKFA